MRWKSEIVSFTLWTIANVLALLLTGIITNDYLSPFIGLSANFLFVLSLNKLIPIISLFGAFFFTSMVLPAINGVIWLCELAYFGIQYFNGEIWIFAAITSATLIFAIIVLLNTFAGASLFLLRFSSLYFHFSKRNAAMAFIEQNQNYKPFVSIHLPCYEEPPDIVIETLNALSLLDYPHFEVIVIDNNTKDESLWKPIKEKSESLGQRFRFFHFDTLKGAKAGALNQALKLTNPKAELVAVVDADYVAEKTFLKELAPLFKDSKVAFVQTCHNYRNWQKSRYLTSCYYEYAVHFQLELPALTEWDSAYTVGTMCLLRKEALESAGGWAEWCLTEDSEIAVRLHALGYCGYYFNRTFGKGLIPETFYEYKKQRFRWTVGPVQEFRRYWKLYLPGNRSLMPMQKISEFFHGTALGFAEILRFLNIPILALALFFAITQDQFFIIPSSILWIIPILLVRTIGCSWICMRLLGGNFGDMLAASLAARSLSYTRFQAILSAIVSKKTIWRRTNKFKVSHSYSRILSSTGKELTIGALYLTIICILFPLANFWPPDLIALMLLGMVIQSFNYFCAPYMAFLSEKELLKETENAGEIIEKIETN